MAKIPTPVSLSDVVKSAADELRKLRHQEVSDPVIALQTCEIELAVSAEVDVGGKLKFVIFEGGADAKYLNSQKIVLTFSMVGAGIVAPSHGEGPAPLPERQ